jgi:hypothetical protein
MDRAYKRWRVVVGVSDLRGVCVVVVVDGGTKRDPGTNKGASLVLTLVKTHTIKRAVDWTETPNPD